MTQDQQQWTAVDRYFTDLLVPFDPVLDAVLQASDAAIQTVGSKGYDGFAIAVVN